MIIASIAATRQTPGYAGAPAMMAVTVELRDADWSHTCEVVVMDGSVARVRRILEPTLQRILRELGKPISLEWSPLDATGGGAQCAGSFWIGVEVSKVLGHAAFGRVSLNDLIESQALIVVADVVRVVLLRLVFAA
jgi:hypothetical protein